MGYIVQKKKVCSLPHLLHNFIGWGFLGLKWDGIGRNDLSNVITSWAYDTKTRGHCMLKGPFPPRMFFLWSSFRIIYLTHASYVVS